MATAPQLETARTILRMANQNDVSAIVDYYTENKVHLSPFEPQRGNDFYTTEYWYKEVNVRVAAFKSDFSFKLFIFSRENPKAIAGSINFANFIRGTFQSCTLGYSIAAAYQGKGYMTSSAKSSDRLRICPTEYASNYGSILAP